jgi:putative transposase
MGKVKIAQLLCRAGLHLGPTTVGRMLRVQAGTPPTETVALPAHVVTATRPNHVWHVDLTTLPTAAGLWTAWLPWALPQRWPFGWWIAVALDHYSRRVTGVAVFKRPPSAVALISFLDRAIRTARTRPKHLITDHGKQFCSAAFRTWCRRLGIRQRFGAVGRYGSLAIIERFIRTIKEECTRRILVPFHHSAFRRELLLYIDWYNGDRPHTALEARTPNEVYFGRLAACARRRYEPRRRWPPGSPCAAPRAPIRGRRGARLDLHVRYRSRRTHLPIVELKRAA